MQNNESRTCPICGKTYHEYPSLAPTAEPDRLLRLLEFRLKNRRKSLLLFMKRLMKLRAKIAVNS